MYDLIGDIHGHAGKLKELLKKMGYTLKDGSYSHPERKVLFVGDYIDRGSEIKETLHIVKSMVDSDNAIALLGNHEYNAICFHYKNPSGGHLRQHKINNIIQHYETLRQFHSSQRDYEDYLEWFLSLPLFFESDSFRAVHACWDHSTVDYLKENLQDEKLNSDLIHQSSKKGSVLYNAIEITLKGKELKLPKPYSFKDKQDHIRTEIRIKWWENPSTMTYRSISVEKMDHLPDHLINLSSMENSNHYDAHDKKVFFGHYWLTGKPFFYRDNICCLDFSVANNGNLVAYRDNFEDKLNINNMVYV